MCKGLCSAKSGTVLCQVKGLYSNVLGAELYSAMSQDSKVLCLTTPQVNCLRIIVLCLSTLEYHVLLSVLQFGVIQFSNHSFNKCLKSQESSVEIWSQGLL